MSMVVQLSNQGKRGHQLACTGIPRSYSPVAQFQCSSSLWSLSAQTSVDHSPALALVSPNSLATAKQAARMETKNTQPLKKQRVEGEELTENETQIYDRQIRLWGTYSLNSLRPFHDKHFYHQLSWLVLEEGSGGC